MKAPGPAAADPRDRPVEDAEFASLIAALGPFEPHPALAVGLSGGADSLCTCLLCLNWCRMNGGSVRAIYVDHGLRKGTALEARLAAKWMARHGISFEVVNWQGEKPATGLQAAARKARYRLLENRCRELGILHLVTGHHLDDQNETREMRHARASGERGMAGMPPIRELDHVRILRPLLALPARRLRATLRSWRQDWIEDPSNRDDRFERIRLRSRPAPSTLEDLPSAAGFARRRHRMDNACATFLARHATPHPLGYVTVDFAGWQSADSGLQRLVLERSIQTVSGSAFPVRSASLDRLMADLHSSRRPVRRSLGGTLITLTTRHLMIVREHRAIGERVGLLPGKRVTWDGRFELRYNGAEAGLMAGPATRTAIELLAVPTRTLLRQRRVPASVLMALPQVQRPSGGILFLGPYGLDATVTGLLEIRTVSVHALAGAAFALVTVA